MTTESLKVHIGDITGLQVDAIVNAANTSLLGGGGVDGAIHRAAGPELVAACRELRGCKTGQAKWTPGFRLPAKFVVHTPGPVWNGGTHGEAELLESCYRRSLEFAQTQRWSSMAFPCISTGIFRFPKDVAARIAVRTIRDWQSEHEFPREVILCAYSEEDASYLRTALEPSG